MHLQVSLGKGHLHLCCLYDQMNISDVVTISSKILLYNELWIYLSAIFFFQNILARSSQLTYLEVAQEPMEASLVRTESSL